jgi:ubiquitin-activating enzyme E1
MYSPYISHVGLSDCVKKLPKTFAECVRWARELFEEYFVRKILQLTHLYPEDAMTKSGLPFWSPPKRFPQAVVFDANKPDHIEFIIAAGKIKTSIVCVVTILTLPLLLVVGV